MADNTRESASETQASKRVGTTKTAAHARTAKSVKSGNRRFLYVIPALLWMALIFVMSAQPAEESSATSGVITEAVVDVVQQIRHDDAQTVQSMTDIVEVMVRKGAHMSEYGILFALILLAIRKCAHGYGTAYSYVFAAALAFAYACSDEIHQLFVYGRAGRATDVLIDMCGVLIAALIARGTGSTAGKVVTAFVVAIAVVTLALALLLWSYSA